MNKTMNKTMNFLKSSVLTITALTFASPVFAEQIYNFNRYEGDLYLRQGKVYKNTLGGMTAIVKMDMPKCDSHSSLTGHVGFSFLSKDNGYFINFKFPVDYLEGFKNVEAFVNVGHSMSEIGYLQITDYTYCEQLDYNK